MMDVVQKYLEELFDDNYDETYDVIRPIEAWDSDDLAALEIIINAELQRRGHDQSVLG
jgi:hypothetical protein